MVFERPWWGDRNVHVETSYSHVTSQIGPTVRPKAMWVAVLRYRGGYLSVEPVDADHISFCTNAGLPSQLALLLGIRINRTSVYEQHKYQVRVIFQIYH